METLQKFCLVLTIVGALNWGFIGLFDINLVELIFGDDILARIIYVLVGIAGIVNVGLLFTHLEDK